MDHRKSALSLFSLFLLGSLILDCSDLKEPIPVNQPAILSVHPAEWLETNSPDFHGLLIRNTQWDWDACQDCHGEDFNGGISEVACFTCHSTIPHPAGWLETNSGNYHGRAIRAAGWQMRNCQGCHGEDYGGATTEVSCLTCHPSTPEDCTVCHGGIDNLTGAPPEDLDGNQATTSSGVGAHTAHLKEGDLSMAFECSTCHLVPGSLYVSGHVDSDVPAEVIFGGLGLVDDANPSWDRGTTTCQNTYCHGNWSLLKSNSGRNFIYSADSMVGNAASPNWIDATTAVCGTCHELPPTGHAPFPLEGCAACHGKVVDANGLIIDKSKHVNGMVNVFAQEYPMF